HAPVLDRKDLVAHGEAQVAAGETAERPAHRVARLPQMEQVLLGFVGNPPGPALLVETETASGFQHEEALQGIDPGAGPLPVLKGCPVELVAHRLGHAPAVGISEAAQKTAGDPYAEGVDEFLPEQPLGHGIEDEGTLTRESDQASGRIDLQEFLQIEFFDTHESPLD